MKQIQQNYRTGDLSVSEVPAPRVSSGGLLVASKVSLISSGTEKQLMDLAKASLAGKAIARPDLVRQTLRKVKSDGLRPTIEKVFAKLDTPIPLGYSLAGEVLEVGRNVSGFSVGDRVACAGAGMANHAEINSVPKNLTVRIPEAVSDEDASFVTLGAIALQGVRQAAPTLGERVVVMGLGLIGLLTVQLLKANGCQVLGFDPNPERAKLAKELGADVATSEGLPEAVADFTEKCGADAVIVAASTKSNEPLNIAAEVSRLKGRIVVVGLVGMAIDREPFYKRELDLRLSMSYGPGRHDPDYEISGHDYPLAYVRWTEQRNMAAFLQLIAEKRVTPQSLITHRFPIEGGEEAYLTMERREPHLAMLLTYPDQDPSETKRTITREQNHKKTGDLGIGFIGLGNYAKSVLLPAVKRIGKINLNGVATSTGISANSAGNRYGFTRISTDSEDIIGDPNTDVVFVATRHNSHAALTIAALNAGKSVFCEKPLAMNLNELDLVLDAAKATDAVLVAGFNRRFAPLLLEAKREIKSRSGPLVMHYRVNAGAIAAESWIQREEGGGRIIGEVCHFVDALSAIADSHPIAVQAISAKGLEDSVSILIEFSDGSTGTIVYTSIGDPSIPKEYIEVFSDGCVVQLTDFCQLTVASKGKVRVEKSKQDKGQQGLVAAFIQAARGDRPPPFSLDQLASTSEATISILEALKTGLPIILCKKI